MEKGSRRREEIPVEDTWALEDIFQTDEAWEQACRKLQSEIGHYETLKGTFLESADSLYKALKFNDKIEEMLTDIYCYAMQKSDQDTANQTYQAYCQKAQSLYVSVKSASSFMEVEMLKAGEDTFRQYEKENPKLKEYRRVLEQLFRQKEHTLSEEMEQMLAEVSALSEAPKNIFAVFNNADLKFHSVKNEEGKKLALTHATFGPLMESRDRKVRKAAYKSLYHAYEGFENTLAAALNANVKQAVFYSRARHFSSSRAYYLWDANVPETVYDNLIEAVHENMPSMYRYVSLRKKVLGVKKLHMYDVYVPLVSGYERQYSFKEAKKLAVEALSPMGEEYLSVLKEGFENRWIDVYANEGKRSGAYSNSTYGTHPYVLLNYQGTLDHVSTLVHEMGHAIHSWFSNHNQPFCTADYRIFVAEVASTCNEALFNHYMLEHAESREEKAYILNHYLDTFKGTLFRQTMFAEFERDIHRMAERGEALTAERLKDHYLHLNQQYFGPEMKMDSHIAMEWARIPHFYSPFYVYQYATGFSAAVALSKKILTEGEKAVKDYMKFLKGGNSLDPIDMLKVAGVNMEEKKPVEEALSVFDKMVVQLENLVDSFKKN